MHGIGKIGLLVALAATAFAGCSKKSEPAPSATQTEVAPAEPAATADSPALEAAIAKSNAKDLFKSRCAVCHGDKGKGDGPGSAALDPKPRNYTDAAWQNSVTDDQLRAVITMGGAAVGKSPNMPSNPDLQAKPKVVDALVQIVRSFGTG